MVVHISPPQTPSPKTTVQDKHYKVGPGFKNIFSLLLSVLFTPLFLKLLTALLPASPLSPFKALT